MKKIKVHHPWVDVLANAITVKDAENIVFQLGKLQYPIMHYRKKENKPDKLLIQRIEKLCGRIFKIQLKEDIEYPFIVISGTYAPDLQAIARLLPMSFSLSTAGSVFNLNNKDFVDIITERKTYKFYEPLRNLYDELFGTSLIVWESITEKIRNGGMYSAAIDGLLSKRVITGKPMIFTAHHSRLTDNRPEKVVTHIRECIDANFGSGVSQTICDSATFVRLEETKRSPRIPKEGI